ncbi:MAG: hypothetical protein GX607_22730 [Myxococcales bacterium]|nr:hypothetical protein [Myxococcales bacterium]
MDLPNADSSTTPGEGQVTSAGGGARGGTGPARSGGTRVFLWPLLLLLGGAAMSLGVAELQQRRALEAQREDVRADLETVRGALSRELFGALHLTEGIAGLITIEGGLSEEKFQRLAGELFRRTDLIRNVVIAPDNVVTAAYPATGNEASIGLDYTQNADQWPSVRRMMDERRMIVAGPVNLVQGGVGVIGRTPIYVSDDAGASRYWGLTSTVLELERLLSRTPLDTLDDRLSVALRGVDGLGEGGAVFWGSADVFDAHPVKLEVPLPSGSWQLAGVPKEGWVTSASVARTLTSPLFLLGCALSALLAGLLLRLLQADAARRREVAQRRVTEAALRGSHRELERAQEILEERVAARTEELRLARDAAQSADRLKSAFLATMSHELRTPLNSIIGFSGILEQGLAGPLNAEQTKQLGMVRRSAAHLLALINDVLDLSKIEAGQLQLFVEEFDAREVVEKAVALVQPQADAKGIELCAVIGQDVGSLESDRRRVEQILLNLLSNALKFTEHGQVRVEVTRSSHGLRFAVTDTGLGIAPDDLPRLFLPFSQVDAGLDRRHEGTGLGLSICKRLVERLGGTIEVTSARGEGSTFCFDLPLRAPARPAVVTRPGSLEPSAAALEG